MAVAAVIVLLGAWHGVFRDAELKERASVFYAPPYQLQSLYVGNRLYQVRYGRRDVELDFELDFELATFALVPGALVAEGHSDVRLAKMFEVQVAGLATCGGKFRPLLRRSEPTRSYVVESNGKCHRTTVTRVVRDEFAYTRGHGGVLRLLKTF